MTLTINGREYTLEYTIEASLYNECAETVMQFMAEMSEGQSREDVKKVISSMSNLPQTTLTMFYAGLLEHHGAEGDNTVPSKGVAKQLVKDYFKEHKEDGKDNFYDLMSLLIEQMSEDGFFRQMGLEQMMTQTQETSVAEFPTGKNKTGKK